VGVVRSLSSGLRVLLLLPSVALLACLLVMTVLLPADRSGLEVEEDAIAIAWPGREAGNCFQDLAYHACRFGLFLLRLFGWGGGTQLPPPDNGILPFFFHNQRKHRTRRCLNVYKRRLRMIRLLNLEVTEVRNTAHGPRRLLREAKGTLIMRHARSKVTNFGYESLKRVEYGVCLLPPIKF
jgi:hypothetical protein